MPRRSPSPSSPTLPTKSTSSSVSTPASSMARSVVSTTMSPRVSSPMPGAKSVSPTWRTVTSVPSGKTVSMWPVQGHGAPAPPSLAGAPRTLPTSSVHTESAPASRSSSEKRAARASSPKGGEGICVSSSRRSMPQASSSSIRSKAFWTTGRSESARTCWA